jgi:hypothetical protein
MKTGAVEWLSNTETGLFRPLPLPDDSLLAFRYTGRGFVPVVMKLQVTENVSAVRFLGQHVVEDNPVVRSWKLDPPSSINLDSVSVEAGVYEPLRHMRLASAYPIVEGYKAYSAPGVRLSIQDELGVYGITAGGSVTPQSGLPAGERFHGRLHIGLWQLQLEGQYNAGDFYDLFGPTRTSRKGYSLGIRFKDFLVYDRPRTLEYTVAASGYWGLERLPEFQNISTSFDEFYTFNGSLRYAFQTRSLGAVDVEKGISWSVNLPLTLVRGRGYPRAYATLDVGFPAVWDHNSVWFRFGAGYAPGDRNEPFANFYFGGFGNNWVDHQEVRRYREFDSFPGVELNEIPGTNVVKGLVEWAPPPVRFRRFGVPSLYCTWARAAIFGGAIVTNIDAPAFRNRVVHAGLQLDFRLVLFSNLSSTLSCGIALAGGPDRKMSREGMFSLRILG